VLIPFGTILIAKICGVSCFIFSGKPHIKNDRKQRVFVWHNFNNKDRGREMDFVELENKTPFKFIRELLGYFFTPIH
jgi:hypothetical protein